MSDIFISYSREDRARVKLLAEALQVTCGWSVWWDPHIPAGKTFDEVIEAAMDEARCVVVIWSETSIKSRWVKTEAGEGLDRGILVPVSIDDVKIPLAFRRIQTAKFSSWNNAADAGVFQKLRVDIASVLGEPLQNINTQPPGSIRSTLQNHPFLEPEMIRIAAGKFIMRDPESEKNFFDNFFIVEKKIVNFLFPKKQHEVQVDNYAIGKYPVTFAEYDRYCEETGRSKPDDADWGRGNRPVINVSWEDAYDYAQWIAEVADKSYRLPSEAEWEYATRGGTQTAYWWGDEFEQGRINSGGSHGKTTPVDSFQPNPFGLYDMLGNVREWTGSLYKRDYDGSEQKCSEKEVSGQRVVRGGSWFSEPVNARSAGRDGYDPDNWGLGRGFRLAQD